jgi:glucosamine kinase
MIVIADSGSSKTAWSLADYNGDIRSATTVGLNPMHTSNEDFIRIVVESEISKWPREAVTHVFFYGAGIANGSMQKEVSGSLTNLFKNAEVSVESDLLGAAHAGFGASKGIIGILGTGSNSGLYNGEEIIYSIAPLGYMLGDEGSGTALGKAFTKQFLRNQLPEPIAHSFRQFYPDYNRLLTAIYTPKQSAKILASMVPFLVEHKKETAIKELILVEIQRYFQLIRSYDSSLPIVLVGSVAYYFKEEIINFAQKDGFVIKNIIKSPIHRLTQYHIEKLK